MQQNIIGSDNWLKFLPQMQVVFDQLNDAVFLIDEASKILVINKSASKLTGFEMLEMVGEPIEAFVLPPTNPNQDNAVFLELDQLSSKNLSADEYPKYQTEILTKAGQKIKVEITYLRLTNFAQPVSCLI
ncbi:MAG: PAS domain S-box protein, partial [Anaerolineaceae bacterium]